MLLALTFNFISFTLHCIDVTTNKRYSDFDWLRREIQKSIQIYIPELPGKALTKQISTLGTSKNEGIYEETFIEMRRQG